MEMIPIQRNPTLCRRVLIPYHGIDYYHEEHEEHEGFENISTITPNVPLKRFNNT